MEQQFPIVFEVPGEVKSTFSDQPMTPVGPWPWPWAARTSPAFIVSVEAAAGQECHEFVLAQIKGWPETKTEMDLRCVKVFGHKICTKVPVIYHRSCTLELVLDVCYPSGGLNDITSCIQGAGMATAVAAIISDGTAALATFKAALEACLLAKGAKWASEISVNLPAPKTDCGPWHPV